MRCHAFTAVKVLILIRSNSRFTTRIHTTTVQLLYNNALLMRSLIPGADVFIDDTWNPLSGSRVTGSTILVGSGRVSLSDAEFDSCL